MGSDTAGPDGTGAMLVTPDRAGAMLVTPDRVTPDRAGPRFSVCTLVTDQGQYAACLASFQAAGFAAPDCEFLFADNTAGNSVEAFAGLNLFLRRAQGRYVILCHQDLQLHPGGRARLDACLADMDGRDGAWGVLGSAGGLADGRLGLRITDPTIATLPDGTFPVRCVSLDEAFLLVKAEANLALSRDLAGFHLYGTDLCLVADTLGWSSWVIDFPIHHLSPGKVGRDFLALREALIAKYRRAFRPRIIATTCTTVPLTSSRLLGLVGRSSKGLSLWRWLLGSGG